MPFYKRQSEELLVAPNFVFSQEYSLKSEDKDTYTYPVDGWYWFDTLDKAIEFMAKKTDNQVVTMRQARLALLKVGLLNNVDLAISNLPSPYNEEAKIEWEFASEVSRNNPLIAAMANELGMTETQLDELFSLAATL